MAELLAVPHDLLPGLAGQADPARVKRLTDLLRPDERIRAVATGRSTAQGELLLAATNRRVLALATEDLVDIPLAEVAYVATSGDSRAGAALVVHGPRDSLRVAAIPFRMAQGFAAAVRMGIASA
ncbi:hypothetical protein [Longimycelium tulufanense]|uniref:hypothetical protein n=1 Tax=Longimycelium tulufanense TaxID=907463 RepID=UPI00166EDA6B|nr:hypothetical protein [Longimycelium tulufanense]